MDALKYLRGLQVSVREVSRTAYQQAEYVRTGKSKTNASKHLDSLAADVYFCRGGILVQTPPEVMDFWEGLRPGNKAGGRFKTLPDFPHFEAG